MKIVMLVSACLFLLFFPSCDNPTNSTGSPVTGTDDPLDDGNDDEEVPIPGTPEGPPAAPSGLTSSAVSSSRIDLSWRDNSEDEEGFRIERKTGSGWSNETQAGTPETPSSGEPHSGEGEVIIIVE